MDWRKRAKRVADDIKLKERQKLDEKFKSDRLRKEAEFDRLVDQNLSKFECHICGTKSKSPLVIRREYIDENDWSKPGDLTQCVVCKKWTCASHIASGVCQTCAGEPNWLSKKHVAIAMAVLVTAILVCWLIVFPLLNAPK